MDTKKVKSILKKAWHFIWEEDSLLSWIVNIILAFVIIKFLVYPGLGLLLGTNYPIVAVVSNSMEHRPDNGIVCGNNVMNYKNNLDNYWKICGSWYEDNNISKKEFSTWSFKNGFNKGDLMILIGRKAEKVDMGDVIVYRAKRPDIKSDPIIHRVVDKWQEDSAYFFQTKGDNNPAVINDTVIGEAEISEERVLGNAVVRIPLLGYVKIIFVEIIKLLKVW
ncbi:signal peptidase I [Candidatus Woesearchaeota archaeon]|nr:signal peptidase I [Candidatus Woesearchaeota archaeon]